MEWIKKHILPIVLCFTIILCFVIPPVTVRAVGEILLTAAIETILSSMLISIGLEFASEVDLHEAVVQLWESMPEEQKQYYELISTTQQVTEIMIVQIANEYWQDIKFLWYEMFGYPEDVEQEIYNTIISTNFGDVYYNAGLYWDTAPVVASETKGTPIIYQFGNNTIHVNADTTALSIQIDIGDISLYRDIESMNINNENYDNIKLWQVRIGDYNDMYVEVGLFEGTEYYASYKLNSTANPYTYIHNPNTVWETGYLSIVNHALRAIYYGGYASLYLNEEIYVSNTYVIPQYINTMVQGGAILQYGIDVNYYPGTEDSIYNPYNPEGVITDGTDDVTLRLPDTSTTDYTTLNPSDVIVTSITETIAIPDTASSNLNKFKAPPLIFTKFPFCIPYDLFNASTLLLAEQEIPTLEIVFPIPFTETIIEQEITIPEELDEIRIIARWFLSLIFVVGLIKITRNMIRG